MRDPRRVGLGWHGIRALRAYHDVAFWVCASILTPFAQSQTSTPGYPPPVRFDPYQAFDSLMVCTRNFGVVAHACVNAGPSVRERPAFHLRDVDGSRRLQAATIVCAACGVSSSPLLIRSCSSIADTLHMEPTAAFRSIGLLIAEHMMAGGMRSDPAVTIRNCLRELADRDISNLARLKAFVDKHAPCTTPPSGFNTSGFSTSGSIMKDSDMIAAKRAIRDDMDRWKAETISHWKTHRKWNSMHKDGPSLLLWRPYPLEQDDHEHRSDSKRRCDGSVSSVVIDPLNQTVEALRVRTSAIMENEQMTPTVVRVRSIGSPPATPTSPDWSSSHEEGTSAWVKLDGGDVEDVEDVDILVAPFDRIQWACKALLNIERMRHHRTSLQVFETRVFEAISCPVRLAPGDMIVMNDLIPTRSSNSALHSTTLVGVSWAGAV